MFGRLASFVQQAAEVLAPTASLQEDFIHHWKAVTHFLVDLKDDRQAIQATNVPDHLTNMVELLVQEESEGDGTTGPCMEYLLQHKILETLHTLGRADCPPGMKQQVLKFFTSVISRAQQPLLPQLHVHKPVLRLIHCCADSRASPTEADEVHFLCTVASSLKQHPDLANVFLEHRPTSTTAEPTSASFTQSPRSSSMAVDPDHAKFHLLATLLELSKSEDRRVSLKACEGMILCASLNNESTARSIANNSPFCQILADRVQSTFAAIPLDLATRKVLACNAKWGMEGSTNEEEPYEGRAELRAWLSWVDYFDQMVSSSHSIVANALLECLQERFFRPQLEPRLAQMSEHGLVVTTALVTKLVQFVTAPLLVHGLILLLVGSSAASSDSATERVELCQHLISRCDHVNEELFNLLLQKNDPLVIQRLVLQHLAGDRHLKPEARGKDQHRLSAAARTSTNSSSLHSSGVLEQAASTAVRPPTSTPGSDPAPPLCIDLTSESLVEPGTSPSPSPLLRLDSHQSTSSGLGSGSGASTPLSLSEGRPATCSLAATPTMPSGLSLSEAPTPTSVMVTPASPIKPIDGVPSTLELSEVVETSVTESVVSPTEIEPLVQQLFAERNHSELMINTMLTMLPEAAKTSLHMPSAGYDEYVRDGQAQVTQCFAACQKWQSSEPLLPLSADDEFSEGPFLHLLFNKLQRSLDQPYEINLTVTGLLTRLAYFPHRSLHAYLLDPFIPLGDNVRSLHSVLRQISAELALRAQRTASFQANVVNARRRLCGTSTVDAAGVQKDNLYEAVVVLEEFCKELAAVTFVKSAMYLQQCSFL